jgi:hypothetical protein
MGLDFKKEKVFGRKAGEMHGRRWQDNIKMDGVLCSRLPAGCFLTTCGRTVLLAVGSVLEKFGCGVAFGGTPSCPV